MVASVPGSGELYVKVAGPLQNCSASALHCGQPAHESTMQPTPARSPTCDEIDAHVREQQADVIVKPDHNGSLRAARVWSASLSLAA